MFDHHLPELVSQALTAELPQFLLSLLESPLEECDSPAAAKAQIVKALKEMEKDIANGEVVTSILNESKVWGTFKEQKHDLFIKHTQVAGYLTGPATGVAGYLTAGPQSSTIPSTTPPAGPPDEDLSHRNDVEIP